MLDEKSRISVYTTFISSNFNYCPVAWIFCGRKNSLKLEKLQERALRFVFNDLTTSYQDLLARGNFLSLSAYRLYFLGIEMYKCKKNVNPSHINSLFSKRYFNYALRDCNKFDQSIFNTIKFGYKSFSYYGAKLWNELPLGVKESNTLSNFKRSMKQWCRTDACNRLIIC